MSRIGLCLRAVDGPPLIIGEIVRTAIYERIQRSYQVKYEEIPEKPEAFHLALQDLLSAGGKVTEKATVKKRYTCLRFDFSEHGGYGLVDYVKHAKEAEFDA